MTIADSNYRNQYTATSGQTVFTYDFRILSESDLNVYVTDTSNNESLQTITTDYTVSGVGNVGGGSVTFVTGVTLNYVVTIVLNRTKLQDIDFTTGGDFPESNLDNGLDESSLRDKSVQEVLDRCFKFTTGSNISAITNQISIESLKGKALGFNSSTGAPEAVNVLDSSATDFLNSITITSDSGSGTGVILQQFSNDNFEIDNQDGGTTLLRTSNVTNILYSSSEVVVNNDQANMDFIVKTQNDADGFVVDASAGDVRIKNANGADLLQVWDTGCSSITDANPQVEFNYSIPAGASGRLGYIGYGSVNTTVLNLFNDQGDVRIDPQNTTDFVINRGIIRSDFGISFDSGSNVLDQYEDGTFTPTLYGSSTAGTPVYSVNEGNYVIVGDVVTCTFRIVITAIGGMVGQVRIDGLPFNAFNDSNERAVPNLIIQNHAMAAGDIAAGYSIGNSNDIFLITLDQSSNFSEASLLASNIDADFELRCTITYRIV